MAVFFIAVGMSLNLGVMVERAGQLVLAIVVGLLAVKIGVLYVLGRRWGLDA